MSVRRLFLLVIIMLCAVNGFYLMMVYISASSPLSPLSPLKTIKRYQIDILPHFPSEPTSTTDKMHLLPDSLFFTKVQLDSIINRRELEELKASIPKPDYAPPPIVFVKTHKTASSTLQNILLRHALLNNQTIALPAYKASFLWPLKFTRQMVLEQRGVRKYDLIAHHMVFNQQEVETVMKPKPIYITILRDPYTLFESTYEYFRLGTRCFNQTTDSLTDSVVASFTNAPLKVCNKARFPIRNHQTFDLGLEAADSSGNWSVSNFIQYIDYLFDVVMITERFDESLLLLRQKLGWSLEDISYVIHNMRGRSNKKPRLSQNSVMKIREFNAADQMLYEYFNQRLDRDLSLIYTKESLFEELRLLRETRAAVTEYCVSKMLDSKAINEWMFRPYGAQTIGYILRRQAHDDIKCRLLILPELPFTAFLKTSSDYIPPDMQRIIKAVLSKLQSRATRRGS